MKTINQNINSNDNNWDNYFVKLAFDLGLSDAKRERKAELVDYYLLGQLIHMTLYISEWHEKRGYVEADIFYWLLKTKSGLERLEAIESIYWLIINGYVSPIRMEDKRLAYKVTQWVLDKANARKTKELIDRADALLGADGDENPKTEKDPAEQFLDESIRRERDRLKKKYDMLISRLKNVNCGISEEAER